MKLLILCLAFLSVSAMADEDEIILKSGRSVKGIVSDETATLVEITTKEGTSYKFEKSKVTEIKRSPVPLVVAPPQPSPSPTPVAEAPPLTPPTEEFQPQWTAFLIMGLTIGPSTSFNIKDVNGTSVGTAKSDDSGAFFFGGELDWQSQSAFGIGFAAQTYKYKYNSGDADDSHLTVYAIPRAQICPNNTCFWGGLGLGLMFTTIGSSSGSANGITTTLDSNKITSLAISPRVGIDFNVAHRVVLGIQGAYTTTAATLDGTVTSSTATARFKADYSRSWMEIGLRAGYQF